MKNKAGQTFQRTAILKREAIDVEKREVEIAFSSETPVDRWGEMEVLDHDPDADRTADFARLNAGAPFCADHDTSDYDKQLGVVMAGTARIDKDGIGRCRVLLSKTLLADRFLADAQAGIRTNVSFGYRYLSEPIPFTDAKGQSSYRVMRWEPSEVSSVACPADTTVGVGRSQESNQEPPKEKILIMETENAVKAERQRVNDILTLARKAGMETDGAQFIESGKTADEFRAVVLEKKFNATPAIAKPDLGMTAKEVKRYSVVKAIREACEGKLSGLEKECNETAQKQYGRSVTNGFIMPHDVYGQRDYVPMASGAATAGAASIQSTIEAGSFIEVLYNACLVAQMGAMRLSGLTGNIALPRQTGLTVAQWVTENGAVDKSGLTLDQIGMTPKRLAASVPFSKLLLIQSSLDVENLVRQSMAVSNSLALDLAAIAGTGANNQPKGIIKAVTDAANANGTVTFGGVPTWAKIVAFETQLEKMNALRGNNVAWLTSPGVKGAWKTTPKTSTWPMFLLEGDQANGYKLGSTNQVASDKVIFGNWADLVLADWAGVDVVVDPYTAAGNAQVIVTTNLFADVAVRHPESFVVSTDAGNQTGPS